MTWVAKKKKGKTVRKRISVIKEDRAKEAPEREGGEKPRGNIHLLLFHVLFFSSPPPPPPSSSSSNRSAFVSILRWMDGRRRTGGWLIWAAGGKNVFVS